MKRFKTEVREFGYEKKDTIEAMNNLYNHLKGKYKLTKKERNKWIKLNVLNKEGQLLMSAGNDKNADALEFMMSGMLWEGLITKEMKAKSRKAKRSKKKFNTDKEIEEALNYHLH